MNRQAIISYAPKMSGVDSRTKMFVLLVCNLVIMINRDNAYEWLMIVNLSLFGILCKQLSFVVKMLIIYGVLLLLQVVGVQYLPDTLKVSVVAYTAFFRQLFTSIFTGGLLIKSSKVSEIISGMMKLGFGKKVIIPVAVTFRYLPIVFRDLKAIREGMSMRGLRKPSKIIEGMYVPLIVSATRLANDLSASTVSRGLESPNKRTSLYDRKMTYYDYVIILWFVLLLGYVIKEAVI